MKPFIFLLCLSILVFVQVNAGIGSTSSNSVTYTELVAKVYEKVKAYVNENPLIRYDVLGHLSFVVNIVDNIRPIQEKFLIHPSRFLEEKNAKWIPSRVPKGLKLSKLDAKSTLTSSINEVEMWINKIKDSYEEISNEISVQPSDEEFIDAYKQWYVNRPSKSHTDLIRLKLPDMRNTHNVVSHRFKTTLNDVNGLEKTIYEDIKKARSMCESMALTQDREDVSKTIEFLNEFPSQYDNLIKLLQKVRDILKEYNKARLTWAELLIGMTKEIGGAREPVLPSKSTVEKLAQATSKKLHLGKQKDKKEKKK